MPVTNYDVINKTDKTGYWGEIVVSDGGFSPFSTRRIFSTFLHAVASLPKRENLYRKWSFELVARLCRNISHLAKFLVRLLYNSESVRARWNMSAIALVQAITYTLVQKREWCRSTNKSVIHEFLGANGM